MIMMMALKMVRTGTEKMQDSEIFKQGRKVSGSHGSGKTKKVQVSLRQCNLLEISG